MEGVSHTFSKAERLTGKVALARLLVAYNSYLTELLAVERIEQVYRCCLFCLFH